MSDSVEPKVSVIIPAYNRESYIRQTVDSVLGQTYQNIELIVVDDGSSDGTRQILEQYGNKLLLLEHEQRANKGQSAAINLGLKKAVGHYVAILDSDDYWHPDKIKIQVEFLEQNPDVGLVYGNGEGVNADGEYLYDIYSDSHYEENKPANVLMDCYFLVPNNALVRKSVFDEVGGFDESLRSAQDHDMAIRIAEVTKLAYINYKWFYYRRHGQSISQKNANLRWNNGFIILEKAIKRYPYSRITRLKRKAVLHFRLFQCAIEKNNYIKALFHVVLSGLYDPLRALKVLSGNEKITSPH